MDKKRKFNFVIIIGGIKCGTSSLFNMLSKHPQINPCTNKEPHFFSKNFNRGINWYLSQWNNPENPDKLLLEASTTYSSYPVYDAARNIHGIKNHDFKLIYLLRDPVEQLISHYQMARIDGWGKAGLTDHIKDGDIILESSRYFQQIDRYLNFIQRENLLILDFNLMKQDQKKLLFQVTDFLNIDGSCLSQTFQKASNTIESRITQKILFKIPGFQFIKNNSPKFIRRGVRNLIYDKKTDKPTGIFRFISQWKKRKYSSISSQSNRDRVSKSLMKDMKRLKASNYFDTSGWKF